MNLREKFGQTVECLCEHEISGTPLSQDSIAMIKEISYSFLTDTLARDLELFRLHAKRATVKPEDVLLCARKNENVRDHMENYIKQLESSKSEEQKTKKSKAPLNSSTTTKPKGRPKPNNNNTNNNII
jgi:histone H3/H4